MLGIIFNINFMESTRGMDEKLSALQVETTLINMPWNISSVEPWHTIEKVQDPRTTNPVETYRYIPPRRQIVSLQGLSSQRIRTGKKRPETTEIVAERPFKPPSVHGKPEIFWLCRDKAQWLERGTRSLMGAWWVPLISDWVGGSRRSVDLLEGKEYEFMDFAENVGGVSGPIQITSSTHTGIGLISSFHKSYSG